MNQLHVVAIGIEVTNCTVGKAAHPWRLVSGTRVEDRLELGS
jgi:hypothetical protein